MGKITDALKKAAEERVTRIEKVAKIKEREQLVIRKVGRSRIDPAIITYFDPKAHITEQYKILRTNLLAMNGGKPPRVFNLTSSSKSEGKTVTALNLAISLAQAVQKPKVLLVDADLRRGQVANYLGVKQPTGFAEYLDNKCELKDIVFNISIDNLTFIPCGDVPPNPAELLASDKMKLFIKDMRHDFDFVIIDTPPIVPVTDAGIVGSMVDGTILIIRAGKTQRGIVHHAEALLNQSHAKILGHVLTGIEYHLPEYLYRYL
jgi:protein-tyrosine kinase